MGFFCLQVCRNRRKQERNLRIVKEKKQMTKSKNPGQEKGGHPMLTEPVGKLLPKFAVPAIIANLVSALYNIVDQIFIGNKIGYYGNAATNVAFPITTVCMALGLMIGVGSASNFNLELGKGNAKRARDVAGTSFSVLIMVGLILLVGIGVFMHPMLLLFGATEEIFAYAETYVGVTMWGVPFLMLSTGGNQLIRSDGSPKWSMSCMVSGALVNVVLDYMFVYVFEWGIAGAAWATVIGQVVSALLVIAYFPRFQNIHLSIRSFVPVWDVLVSILALGLTPMFNQISNLVVQLVLNNLLRKYGAASVYGSEIPLAVAGIVTKVNMIFSSIVLGIANGLQPIAGFNYGAKQYGRVKSAYRMGRRLCFGISIGAFLCFEVLAEPIISLFGSENELYMEFATSYLRVFLFCTFLNGVQIISTIFFSVIGKAKKGAILAITRQVLLLVPCLFAAGAIAGVNGIKYAGPVADSLAFAVTMWMIHREFQNIDG